MKESPSSGAKLKDYEAFIAIVDTGYSRSAVLTRRWKGVERPRDAEVVLDDFTLAPIPAHAVWPSGPRTASRVRRFVDLLADRLKKEVI